MIDIGVARAYSAGLILSRPLEPVTSYVYVTDVFYNSDGLTYSYFFITVMMTMMVVLMIRMLHAKKRSKRLLCNLFACSCRFVWNFYAMFLGNDNYSPVRSSRVVLWLFINLFTFIAIGGILLNLMSTDLIAVAKPATINSLADYLSPTFYDMPSFLVKNFLIYNLIMSSQTKAIQDVKTKLLTNSVDYVKDIDFSDSNLMSYIEELKSNVSASKMSLILDSQIWYSMAKYMCCARDSELTTNLTASESFAEGTINMAYSKSINKQLRKYVDHKSSEIRESGILLRLQELYMLAVINEVGMEYSYKARRCYDEFVDENTSSETLLPLDQLSTTFLLVGYGFSLALIILLIEKFSLMANKL